VVGVGGDEAAGVGDLGGVVLGVVDEARGVAGGLGVDLRLLALGQVARAVEGEVGAVAVAIGDAIAVSAAVVGEEKVVGRPADRVVLLDGPVPRIVGNRRRVIAGIRDRGLGGRIAEGGGLEQPVWWRGDSSLPP
jgi:hypothetical protein